MTVVLGVAIAMEEGVVIATAAATATIMGLIATVGAVAVVEAMVRGSTVVMQAVAGAKGVTATVVEVEATAMVVEAAPTEEARAGRQQSLRTRTARFTSPDFTQILRYQSKKRFFCYAREVMFTRIDR